MHATPDKSAAESAHVAPTGAKRPSLGRASVPETLAALHVDPDVGLRYPEVDVHRKEHGYNEVTEEKAHPVIQFLGKFWGISAWVLELM